jgi:hypothetical protein
MPYLLNPQFAKSPGSIWWTKRLRYLQSDLQQYLERLNPQSSHVPEHKEQLRNDLAPSATALKIIAKEILVIEYFPYHSGRFLFNKAQLKKFEVDEGVLPSQQYSFYLLQEAMNRDALIILVRKKKEWQRVNSLLKKYHRYCELKPKCRQSAVIRPKSFDDGGYEKIIRELEKTVK